MACHMECTESAITTTTVMSHSSTRTPAQQSDSPSAENAIVDFVEFRVVP